MRRNNFYRLPVIAGLALAATASSARPTSFSPQQRLPGFNIISSASVSSQSDSGGRELRNGNFYDGALPTVSAVLETSTWAMMLAGLALAGVILQTRPQPRLALVPARIRA